MGMSFSLNGKKAIITGAGKRTGLCLAMAEAVKNAGAEICLMDISDEVFTRAEELGGEKNGVYAVRCDITDEADRQRGFDEAVAKLGGWLDILVNGAGVQHREPAEEFSAQKWNFVININLSAVFFMCQLAAKKMIEQGTEKGRGKIINIASMTSFVASKNIPAYSASKGGVAQLTKALSNEWASKGINVNAVAPGYMKTELTANMINTPLGQMHTTRIPMGRWGNPDDLGGPIVFLASEAADYVSGVILPVDGGYLGL